jgi:PKD repeat protein
MLRILPLFIALLLAFSGYSQCLQQPVSIQARTLEAEIVAEGLVDSSYCVWNTDHNLILTIHRFNVYKYFKGASANRFIDIITLGGELNGELHAVEPELHLEKGMIGVFFLKKNNQQMSSVSGRSAYIPVAGEQGLIEYDLISKSAFGPFENYSSLSSNLYPALTKATGHTYSVINPFNINTGALYRILATPTITSFAPNPITAGTNSVLTINGTNFGATYSGSANVEFKNADNGGAGFISTPAANIVSWSDLQIKVKVPSPAGTGTIRVTNATAESVVSGSNLTITYNQSNVNSGGIGYEPNLINRNGLGGYSYTYSTATANNGVSFDGNANAKAHFATALSNWNCNTGFNVVISGSNTAIGAPANDGTNVIMFDNDGAPLPTGILGRTTSFYSSCDGTNWYVNDVDIVFKRDGTDGVTWYFGVPGSQPGSTTDFESVALHELGHSHQLGHVILLGSLMHFVLTTGTNNRSLNPTQDIAGGLYVMGHSNTFAQCGKTGMTNFNCTLPPVANFSATPLSACSVPAPINFTDLSLNAPTSWSWTFTGGTPASSIAQNPSGIVYNASGTYSVTLTATNANGSNAITKTGYITVGGSTVPLTETFEGTFLPAGYSIVDADAGTPGEITWQQTPNITGLSGAATKAAYMNCFNYSIDIGTTDDLITLKFNLIGSTASQLGFDLAYQRFDATSYERLQIFLSTDCGITYPTQIYNKSGSDADGNNLSTTASTPGEFFPTAAGQWRRETIDLTPYVGSIIVLKFKVTNGFGNNLFIDNINVTGNAGLGLNLESFNASKSGSAVALSWRTTESDKTEVYKVERSSDGVSFTEILSVNSSQGKNSYAIMDNTPGSGLVYYRLKQTQEDANFNYSPVVAVDMTSKPSSPDIILFPNPVSSGEIFSFESQEQVTGDLKLFDVTGKQIDAVSFNQKGSFVEVSVNVNAGVYIVEYKSEGLIRKGKVMVK